MALFIHSFIHKFIFHQTETMHQTLTSKTEEMLFSFRLLSIYAITGMVSRFRWNFPDNWPQTIMTEGHSSVLLPSVVCPVRSRSSTLMPAHSAVIESLDGLKVCASCSAPRQCVLCHSYLSQCSGALRGSSCPVRVVGLCDDTEKSCCFN